MKYLIIQLNPKMIVFKYIIACCLLFGWFVLNKKNRNNKLLLFILLNLLLTEIIANFLSNLGLLYSISFIIHHSLWLWIMVSVMLHNSLAKLFLIIFYTFSILNLLFIEKELPNFYTYVVGSIVYIILFIIESYRRLQQEDFDFIQSNTYLLIFAPVFFFLIFSFMFGYGSSELMNIYLYNKIDFYDFIAATANTIYYFLILVYIYKEFKNKNV